MTNRETIRIEFATVRGEPVMNMAAMGLLWGVLPSELAARISQPGEAWSPLDMPAEWMQRAKRRAAEARAHTNSNDLEDVLRYWADKDCNADLEVVYL